MNLLIDIGHPAHVHLFRNAAKKWMENGHQVIFTIRDRGIVKELMTSYGFQYTVASKAQHSTFGLFSELLEHDFSILKMAKENKVDIMMGTSVSITHASVLTGIPSVVFCSDDANAIKIQTMISYPFANTIVIPQSLKDKRTRKYVTHNSFHELAYLHPHQFTPDPSILQELGVKKGEKYFIIRLVSLMAAHDKGHEGISQDTLHRIINVLSQYGKVFIDSEKGLGEDVAAYKLNIPVTRIHHALAFATMVVCDSQTMAREACILGTPAIRMNTFVGLISVLEDLEHQFGLTYGFLPSNVEAMFEKIQSLLDDPNLKQTWEAKRQIMLSEKIDLAEWMVNFIQEYPASFKRLRAK
jgi:uncharacterized protein